MSGDQLWILECAFHKNELRFCQLNISITKYGRIQLNPAIFNWPNSNSLLQVYLCQKLLFLHQLTYNMTTDCSLFMKIVSSEYLQNMLCTQIVVFVLFCFDIQNNFGTQHVLQMLRASEKDLPIVRNIYVFLASW